MLTVTKIKKSKNPKKGPKILEILENFRNFSKMRRIFDGESPAQMRIIFRKYGAFAPAIRRRKRVALAKNSRPRILRKWA